jgi:hypothetical protein
MHKQLFVHVGKLFGILPTHDKVKITPAHLKT